MSNLTSNVMTVMVLEVKDRVAFCRDTHGGIISVRCDIMRAKGLSPIVGETWIIDTSLGLWSFAAIVGAPEINSLGGGSGNQTFVNQQFEITDPTIRNYELISTPVLSSETVALNGINLNPAAGDYTITDRVLNIRIAVTLVASDVLSIRYAKES